MALPWVPSLDPPPICYGRRPPVRKKIEDVRTLVSFATIFWKMFLSPNTREGGEALSDIHKNGCERDFLPVINNKKFSPESRVKCTNHITSDLVVSGHAREEGIIGESDGKHGKLSRTDRKVY